MAYTTTTVTRFSLIDRFRAAYDELAARYSRYRVYRTTFNELNALSPRDLADLGINASMISSIAYDAAYK